MRILLTGASSFSGSWFVKELVKSGHEVVTIFQRPYNSYSGLRRSRVESATELSESHFECAYGSKQFFDLIKSNSWDLFCHHAADVNDYKSPQFNVVSALQNNTGALQDIIKMLQESGCHKILLTGSVFEQNEGAGSNPLRAVSPYGMSKGLTWEMFKYYSALMGMKLGKFVIPNPFGPFEEFRFTSFLVKQWLEDKPADVTMPSYVRDNIHVSLLAKAYANFAESLKDTPGVERLNPSGYPEAQGSFVARFARELSPRLVKPCEYVLKVQTDFSEPMVRINTDVLPKSLGWNESEAWDQLAEFYLKTFAGSFI